MAEGKLQRSSGGKLKRNADGKLVRNSSSSSECCCEAGSYCATTCCDDACEGVWITGVKKPFYFKYMDVCYYAGAAGTPGEGETVLEAGDVEAFDSCDDCLERIDIDCPADTVCASCGNDACNNPCDTPDTFTVTFSGITTYHSQACIQNQCESDWMDGFDPPSNQVGISNWSGGTFTLTQTGSCTWQGTGTGPTVTAYSGTNCGTEDENSSTLIVSLTATTLSARVAVAGLDFYLFYKDFTLVCCESNSVASAQASNSCEVSSVQYFNPSDGSLGLFTLGYGGTATVTPC